MQASYYFGVLLLQGAIFMRKIRICHVIGQCGQE